MAIHGFKLITLNSGPRVQGTLGTTSLNLQTQTADSFKCHKDAEGEERENDDEFNERLASAGRMIHL